MGTRGCVAIRREDGGWQGVYNHFDSYPTGLGEEVFEHFRAIPREHRQTAALALLQTDDWREYLNDGECEYCGVVGKGQPHSIYIGRFYKTKKHLRTGAPVPKHSHTRDRRKVPEHITSENTDALWHEWVYVIDPFKNEIEVLYRSGEEIPGTVSMMMTKEDGTRVAIPKSRYSHISAGVFSIDEDFPAEKVEQICYSEDD